MEAMTEHLDKHPGVPHLVPYREASRPGEGQRTASESVGFVAPGQHAAPERRGLEIYSGAAL